MLAARMGSAEAVNVLLNSATSDVPVEHGAICKAAREMHKWKTAVEAIKAAAAAAGSPVSNRAEFSKLMRDAAQAEQDEEKKTTKAAGTIGAQIVDDIDVTGLGKDDDHYAEEADAKVKSGKGKRAPGASDRRRCPGVARSDLLRALQRLAEEARKRRRRRRPSDACWYAAATRTVRGRRGRRRGRAAFGHRPGSGWNHRRYDRDLGHDCGPDPGSNYGCAGCVGCIGCAGRYLCPLSATAVTLLPQYTVLVAFGGMIQPAHVQGRQTLGRRQRGWRCRGGHSTSSSQSTTMRVSTRHVLARPTAYPPLRRRPPTLLHLPPSPLRLPLRLPPPTLQHHDSEHQ